MLISHVCKATPESLKLAAPFEAEHTQDEQVQVLNSCLRSLAPVAKIDKTFISGESMAATLNFKRSNHAQIACPVHETTPAVSVFSRPSANAYEHALLTVKTGSTAPDVRVGNVDRSPSRLLQGTANSSSAKLPDVLNPGCMSFGCLAVLPDNKVGTHTKPGLTAQSHLTVDSRSLARFDSRETSKRPPTCNIVCHNDKPILQPDEQKPEKSFSGNENGLEAGLHIPHETLGCARQNNSRGAVLNTLESLPPSDVSPGEVDQRLAAVAPVAQTVMQRLQRAMESRSRLEAENRKKLELDSRRSEQERNQRELEAAERRRAKDVAEVREREEKRRRHMKLQQAQKEQEHAQRAAEEEEKRMRRLLVDQGMRERQNLGNSAKRKNLNILRSAEEKKRRLQEFISSSTVSLANETCASAAVQDKPSHLDSVKVDFKNQNKSEECMSYEISPYRSGSDTDEDEERGCPRKPIPDWARTDALVTALTKQASVDPDSIFQNTTKTCSLGSVFTSHTVEKMENRRSSSGDWFSDRLTWREELRYKQDMGFAANNK